MPAAPAAALPASTAPSSSATPPAPSAARPNDEATTGDWLDEAGNELEQMAVEQEKPRPARRAPPKPSEPEPEPEPEPQPVEPEPQPSPESQPQPQAAEPEPVDWQKMPAPQLRKAFRDLDKRVRSELEPEIQRLNNELKEARTAPVTESEETKGRLADYEKRLAAQEATIRFLDYQKSDEFNTKHLLPWQSAYKKAERDVAQLTVETKDGSTRKATMADIMHLAQLGFGEDRKQANAMFGDAADDILHHVRKLRDLGEAQEVALEEAKTNAAKLAEDNQKTGATMAAERLKNWRTNNTEIATKYPGWFAKDEKDPVGNAVLQKGFALADLLFAGQLEPTDISLLPKSFQDDLKANKGKLSPAKQMHLHVLIRNKAAGFDRLIVKMAAMQKELAAAKKTLAEYGESEPPAPGARQAPRTAKTGSAALADSLDAGFAEIDELARKSR